MTVPGRAGEDGSALIIALFFVTIFAVLVATVVTFTEVGLRATKTFDADRRSTYAADGAINAAVNRYASTGPCDNFTAPRGPDGEAVNGEALVVRCDGPPPGAARANKPVNALLSLGPEGITSTGETRVLGSVFSNSTVAAGATMVVQGEVGAIGNCTGPIQTSPAVPLKCANTGGGANPADGRDPGYTKATAAVPMHRTAPPCPAAPAWLVTLEPGHYDDAAALSALTGGGCPNAVVWFKPGNYYLDFTFRGGAGAWTINDPTVDVVAGEPRGWDPQAPGRPTLTLPGSCKTEADGPVDGVQFVVGGASHLQIDRGRVELCAEPNPADQSIAMYGIAPDAPSRHLEPTAVGTVSGFTEPGRALIIGEAPVAASEAALTPASTREAEITLTGFRPSVPAGSLVDAVALRVAHREDANVAPPTVEVTFPGASGGTCTPAALPRRAALTEDRVDLRAACALTSPSAFADLEVTYKLALATGPSGTGDLDGLALEVRYREPTTRKPTAVTASASFTNPGRALEIDEQPALLATAALTSSGATTASITLGGLGNPPIAPGSTIDSAVLRVAHRDEGDLAPPTVSVPFAGGTCANLPLPINATAVLDDRVNLKACGLDDAADLAGLTATYRVALASGGSAGTASLDGMYLELVYRPPPAARPPSTVSDVVAFTAPDNARAIGEQPTVLTADAALDAITPTAALKVSGFAQPVVPAGSYVDAAVLRVAHRDDGNVGAVTVTPSFPGNLCGGQSIAPRPGAVGVDTVDLRACGLTDPSQLGDLAVVFTVALAPGGTAASERLDGIVLELTYRPVATFGPATTSAVSGFTNPDNARVIGEAPNALTADAVFGAATTPASLTLGGFAQVPVPSGSAIDSAVLRVAHRDEGMAAVGLTATFDGMAAGTCGNPALPLRTGAVGEDRVELKAACGFTSAAQLSSLTATYTATPLGPSVGGTQVPASTSAVTAFANPDQARAIDATTADAVLTPATPSASVTLAGYDQPPPPADSVIHSAALRVAHRDEGDIGTLTVTVSSAGTACATRALPPRRGALGEDTIDLAPCGITGPAQLAGLSVTYVAQLAGGATGATALLDGVVLDLAYKPPAVDRLDGVVLDVVFRPPTFEPLGGCLGVGPYPAQPGSCALVRVTIPATSPERTRLAVAGTVYAPTAALDIAMTGLRSQVFSRGLIARAIRIGLQPAADFRRPTAGIPPETVVFTAYPDGSVTPTTVAASVRFAPADRARAIDGNSARATIPTATDTSASITLRGYGSPLPAGTTIDSAVLRVAHGDEADIGSATVTVAFPGSTCGAGPVAELPLHTAVVTDQVDLTHCGLTNTDLLAGLTVTYTATVRPGAPAVVRDELDGMTLDVLSGPVLRASVRFDRGQATVLRWTALP